MITRGAIRTVGVDLSAEPDRSAICAVTWRPGAASVEPPIRPADDAAVLAACASADRVRIDCPFGWPEPFSAAVSAHAAGQPWPGRRRTDRDTAASFATGPRTTVHARSSEDGRCR